MKSVSLLEGKDSWSWWYLVICGEKPSYIGIHLGVTGAHWPLVPDNAILQLSPCNAFGPSCCIFAGWDASRGHHSIPDVYNAAGTGSTDELCRATWKAEGKGPFDQIREEFREGSVCLTPVGWKEPSRSHFRAISCISGFHEKHFIWPSSPNTLGFCHWDICCKSQAPGNARISIGKVVHLVRLLFMPTAGGITRPRQPAC